MADFDAKYAKCPYYIRTNGNRICCEGVDEEENSTINVVFESPVKQDEYKQRYCNDIKGCHACLVYGMLDRKWEAIFGRQ